MMRKLIILGSVLLGLNANADTLGDDKDFDSTLYLGKWYEIARLPNVFQGQCQKNVSALYTLNASGLKVLNRCETDNGEYKEAIGQAYLVNREKRQLKVTFLPKYLRWVPFMKGDYWILKLDPNYQVSLVGDHQKKYLWLLARSPHLEVSVINDYLKYAEDYGYKDLSTLIYSQHDSK